MYGFSGSGLEVAGAVLYGICDMTATQYLSWKICICIQYYTVLHLVVLVLASCTVASRLGWMQPCFLHSTKTYRRWSAVFLRHHSPWRQSVTLHALTAPTAFLLLKVILSCPEQTACVDILVSVQDTKLTALEAEAERG